MNGTALAVLILCVASIAFGQEAWEAVAQPDLKQDLYLAGTEQLRCIRSVVP